MTSCTNTVPMMATTASVAAEVKRSLTTERTAHERTGSDRKSNGDTARGEGDEYDGIEHDQNPASRMS